MLRLIILEIFTKTMSVVDHARLSAAPPGGGFLKKEVVHKSRENYVSFFKTSQQLMNNFMSSFKTQNFSQALSIRIFLQSTEFGGAA